MTIPLKNKEGIARMREACAIAAAVLDVLKPLVRAGVSTQDLEEVGRTEISVTVPAVPATATNTVADVTPPIPASP